MRLIFVHVPKCGGSSLRGMLERSLPGKLFRDYAQQGLFLEDNLTEKTRVIIGHFRARKYSLLIKQGWKLATFLREPMDRLESHFNFLDQTRQLPRPWIAGPIPETVADFCLDPRFANVQTEYLDLALARFAFVGLVERFAEDAAKLVTLAGGTPRQTMRINVFRHRERISDLPESVQAQIRALHAQDLDLYAAACRKRGISPPSPAA